MWQHVSLCGCLTIRTPNPSPRDIRAKKFTIAMKNHYRKNKKCRGKALANRVWQERKTMQEN